MRALEQRYSLLTEALRFLIWLRSNFFNSLFPCSGTRRATT
jgi:hypothetical protein